MEKKMKVLLLTLLFTIQATMAADTFLFDNINANPIYKDSSGNRWKAIMNFTSDGSGNPVPLFQQDLIANTHNYYPTKERNFVTGKRASVDNTKVDIWEGPTDIYVFPTVAQQMKVVSSSANDTLAGTGIQKVLIHYLDASYNAQLEVVSLNGTTPVATVATNILRINGIHAWQVGTVSGVAAGNISLTNTAGTVTYGYITLGNNTARQAIFTIPAGKTGYLNHWQSGAGASTSGHFTQIDIVGTTHHGVVVPGVFLFQDGALLQDASTAITFPIPTPFPAMTDIKMQAISDGGTANVTVTGTMMGWLE